jgi:hypothetical protein
MHGKLFCLVFVVLSGCTIGRYERVAIEKNDHELYCLVDAYYETVWNAENNRPYEKDSLMKCIRKRLIYIRNK